MIISEELIAYFFALFLLFWLFIVYTGLSGPSAGAASAAFPVHPAAAAGGHAVAAAASNYMSCSLDPQVNHHFRYVHVLIMFHIAYVHNRMEICNSPRLVKFTDLNFSQF